MECTRLSLPFAKLVMPDTRPKVHSFNQQTIVPYNLDFNLCSAVPDNIHTIWTTLTLHTTTGIYIYYIFTTKLI